MMAGLEWGPLSIARSPSAYTIRIPMSVLDTRSSEAMLESNEKSRVLLRSIVCRRHVFFMGGVPRFVEQYARYVLGEDLDDEPKLEDKTLFEDALQDVFTNLVNRAWVFKGVRDRLKLIAHALSVADQRKRKAVNSISQNLLGELVTNANIVPTCLGGDCQLVTGLFNVFPQTVPEVPSYCFLVCANETASYHGCFALHPASDPRVYVNSDHKSALALIDGISSSTAEKIIAQREEKLFVDVEEFLSWLKENCDLVLDVDQINRLVV